MIVKVIAKGETILDIDLKALLLIYLYHGDIPLGVSPEDVEIIVDGENIGDLEIGGIE